MKAGFVTSTWIVVVLPITSGVVPMVTVGVRRVVWELQTVEAMSPAKSRKRVLNI
jgi:hypothetical protein